MKQKLAVLWMAAALGGCAVHEKDGGLIVDKSGVDPVAYERDLAECRNYALQVDVGKQTATGAAVGAAVGGAMGAIVGDPGQAAGVGAVGGGTHGALSAAEEQKRVLRNCMSRRGYHVYN
jgi:outer membrane lipoprotein SlyB